MISIIFGISAFVCFIVSIISIKIEPRRIFNGFLTISCLVLLYITLVSLSVGDNSDSILFIINQIVIYALYVLIFILGVSLIADFIVVIKKEGLSIPNVLPLFFGGLAIVVSFSGFYYLISGISGSEVYVKTMSVLYNIVLFLPYAIGAVMIYSIIYLHLPKTKSPDYIIVLGCGLRSNGEVTPLLKGRLKRAVKYYHKTGDRCKFVTSGGQGKDEVISEAQAMKNYLLSQDIPEDMIIMEDKSTNTRENLLFSKKIIENDGCGDNILICTSNYHVLRAVVLARSVNLDAQGIGGHTALYYLPVAFIREYIAMIANYKILILVYIIIAVVTGLFL